MEKPFFIMMYNQKGTHVMPMVNENEDVMLYESEEEARDSVKDHPYAQSFGYEIFEMGTGEI